jgi:hypothetical protein
VHVPGRWRSANEIATDWDYDIDSELERLGADPRIVGLYVLLARAIRDGRYPSKELTRSNGRGPRLTAP